MDILYLGSVFPESRYEEIISDSKGVIQNAGNTYQNAILEGLSSHIQTYSIITSPMLGSFPFRYKRFFFKGNSFEFHNLKNCTCTPFINLSLYKIYSRYANLKQHVADWAISDLNSKHIIIFSLDLSLLKTAYELKKKHSDLKVCLIVTDLVPHMVVPNSIITKPVMRLIELKTKKYLRVIDSFVLLTKYMTAELNIGDRPYTVIEGIYRNQIRQINEKREVNKTILYSGTLACEYGLDHLLRAFGKIRDHRYRLWMCGEGDFKKELLAQAEQDNRIIYWGQLKREEVLALQKRATVLVNPRLSKDEFTKYSFPSKTMEYMASGTPTIMHPLKCLPEEYYQHLYVAYDESDEGLMKTITEVCEKEPEELIRFGNRSSEFIINHKNSHIQVGKMLEMMKNGK